MLRLAGLGEGRWELSNFLHHPEQTENKNLCQFHMCLQISPGLPPSPFCPFPLCFSWSQQNFSKAVLLQAIFPPPHLFFSDTWMKTHCFLKNQFSDLFLILLWEGQVPWLSFTAASLWPPQLLRMLWVSPVVPSLLCPSEIPHAALSVLWFSLTFLSITLLEWIWDLSGEGCFPLTQFSAQFGPFVIHLCLTFSALWGTHRASSGIR